MPEPNTEQSLQKIVQDKMKEINKYGPKNEQKGNFDVAEKNSEKPIENNAETINPQPSVQTKKQTSVQKAPSAQNQAAQMKNTDQQNQVKQLCEIAFTQGIDAAVEVAKKLDNAYVLDELHDTLIDKLYQKLVTENKLKQL